MKQLRNLFLTFGITFWAASAFAQGTFQNLNFEAATPGTPISGPLGQVYQPTTLALPGWSAYLGSTPLTEILQNEATVNQASIDIIGPTEPPPLGPNGAPGIIDGQYTVVLQGGTIPLGGPGFDNASIEQVGAIPAGDNSLEFKAWESSTTSFSVSINGNSLPLAVLATTATYTLYGADISAYAGNSGTLQFSAIGGLAPSFLELDDIGFSTSSVPEPTPAILIPIGALAVTSIRKRLHRL